MKKRNAGGKLMISNLLLSLDYSTTCTGWSIFDIENKKLLFYGIIKPKVLLLSKMKYPKKQLEVCKSIAEQLWQLILKYNPDRIVMEEINRHKSRLSGKTLDGGHYIFYYKIQKELAKVTMMDSDGKTGWRTRLQLFMSDADKLHNKEAKKLNKKLLKGTKKIPKITKKHLAARFVNSHYCTSFDVDAQVSDADISDSIGLGHAFLYYVLPTLSTVQ